MGINHHARTCTFSNCPKCNRRHNSKLHLAEGDKAVTVDIDDTSGAVEHSLCATQDLAQSMHVSGYSVILATAVVFINDISGIPQPCRALLDSGSQFNFITDACAQSLKLSRTKYNLPIVGINSMRSNAQKLHPVLMSSRFNNFSTNINLYLLPTISNKLPAQSLKVDHLKIPEIVKGQLTDPNYGVPGEIHLLLGTEVFYTLFVGEKLDITSNLTFHKTVLG